MPEPDRNDGRRSGAHVVAADAPLIERHWTALTLALAAAIVAVDALTPPSSIYLGLLVAPPLMAAGRSRPGPTLLVAVLSSVSALLLGIHDQIWFTGDHLIRTTAVTVAGGIAVYAAWARHRLDQTLALSESTREAIYRISEAAQHAENLDDLFGSLHGVVAELMPARNFYIALYDAATDLISFPYFRDEYDPAPAPKHPGHGCTEYVLRTGRTMLVTPEVMDALAAAGEVELSGAPSIDWLGVPLAVGARVIGVLVVQTYTEGVRYTRRDADMLEFVSVQVAMAIERTRTAAELRDSEDRFRRLVEHAPDAIIVHCDGVVVFANPAAARLLGVAQPSDLIGRVLLDLVHPDFRAIVRERVAAIAGGAPGVPTLIERLVRADGSPVDVEVQASATTFRGRPAVQALARDVTERLRAEEQMRTQAAALNAAANSILILDRDGRIEWANDAMLTLSGFSLADLRGQRPGMIRGSEHDEAAAADLWAALHAGRVWHGTMANERPDGTRYDAELTITPLADRQGTIVRFLAVGQDVTAQRAAEAQMRVQAAALDAVANPILITDAELRIEWVNSAFTELTQYPLDEVIGRTPAFLREGTGDDDTFSDTATAARIGAAWRGEVRNRCKDGTMILLRSAFTPVRDARGVVTRYVGVAQDITTERRLEDQLRQSQKMEAIGELAGGVAHDFNNLLTAVLASAELLEELDETEAQRREHLKAIRGAAERGADLTRKLLAFSRRQALRMVSMDLGAAVTDFMTVARRLVAEDVDLAVDIRAPGATVHADLGAIDQILLNLITNARDALDGGGRIAITVRRGSADGLGDDAAGTEGDHVVLLVRDSGSGMDAETLRRVFEPFYTTKALDRGTGLGMALVYGLVVQHRGTVQVASEPGQGTEVRVALPAIRDPAVRKRMPPAHTGLGGHETVLVVEDDADVRRAATRALERFGYTVHSATDGRDALDQLAAGLPLPDAIVSDVVMPRATGPEMARELRAQGLDIPIMFMSGHPARDVSRRGALDPTIPFLAKPWTIDEFLARVRATIDAHVPASE